MNDTEKNKILHFLEDKVLQGAVYKVLEDCFKDTKGVKEVNYLAGQMIALEKLKEAWSILQRYKKETLEEDEKVVNKQIGL